MTFAAGREGPKPPDTQFGLIGDTIANTRAPRLHAPAGLEHGLRVRHDRLVPREVGLDLDLAALHAGLARG